MKFKKLLTLIASLRAARLQRLSTKWTKRSQRLLRAGNTTPELVKAWRGS